MVQEVFDPLGLCGCSSCYLPMTSPNSAYTMMAVDWPVAGVPVWKTATETGDRYLGWYRSIGAWAHGCFWRMVGSRHEPETGVTETRSRKSAEGSKPLVTEGSCYRCSVVPADLRL